MEKEKLLKLIKMYREREALWNIHSPVYKWAEVKREAIAEIANEMKMSEEEVRRKIKSVRGTYVVEKTKVEKRKKAGASAKGVSTSTLWWYNEMSFLDKCIIRRTTHSLAEDEKMETKGNNPDIYDTFCSSVKCQLRALNEKDAFIAMEKIQNILSVAKIERLERENCTSNSEGETNDLSENNDSCYPLEYEEEETQGTYIDESEESQDMKPSIEIIESIEAVDPYTEIETIEKWNSESTDEMKTTSSPTDEVEDYGEEYVVKLKPKSTRFTTKERKFQCPICGYAGTDRSNMLSHIQRHSKNKPHKCNQCEKAFHTRTELNTHMRSHTGERPFLCTICGTGFSQSSQLNIHIKRHNKIKDKECHICQKKFYDTKNLREHLNIHSDKREHRCTECNASFKQKMCLKNHMKLHENKRSYECKLCDSKFNQRGGLYSHMKTNHTALSTSVSVLI